MRKTVKQLSLFIVLLGATTALKAESSCVIGPSSCQPCRNPKTTFRPRPQGRNMARYLVGMESYTHKANMDDVYGALGVTAEYTRSFRPDLITDYFFGRAASDGQIKFSGSRVAGRGDFDILADYFGLPQDYESIVSFKPRIENFVLDLNAFIGLDRWCPHTYLTIQAPLVHARWDMDPSECFCNKGTTPFPHGYMDKDQIARANLPESVLESFAGGARWGDMQETLKYGRICSGTVKRTRLADIHLALGHDFCVNDVAHMGFNIFTVVPTGNKPTGKFLFDPIVGNGGHFEVGLGFSSHLTLWENEDQSKSWAVYSDINVTHQFGTIQTRSFDFEDNGPGSRYILAARYQKNPNNPDGTNIAGHLDNIGVIHEYADRLTPAINLTTLCAEVSAKVHADWALKFAYKSDNWEWDIGYELWARTRERIQILDEIEKNVWALKGDAYLFGAVDNTGGGDFDDARTQYNANAAESVVKLTAMQEDLSTFYTGGNSAPDETVDYRLNPGIDTPEQATALTTAGANQPVFSPDQTLPAVPAVNIFTSNPIDFISEHDDDHGPTLDPRSAAAPSQLSHKFFTHVNYSWQCEKMDKEAFIGMGGELEFDTDRRNTGKACECRNALNQWGLWIKGGFAY